MTAIRIGIFLACAALTATVSVGQEPTKSDPVKPAPPVPAPKVDYRGQLPFYWGQLGLTDQQRQEVYKINAEYGAQMAAPELKIEQLKEKRDQERFKVLSPVQKDRLEAIIRDKIGGK